MIIRKVGAVVFNELGTKIAVVREHGRSVFIIPGGRPEGNETELQTLARELYEELTLTTASASLLGRYIEPAEFDNAELHMSVYLVKTIGVPVAANEVLEIAWVDGAFEATGIMLGSTLRNHVIPELIRLQLLPVTPSLSEDCSS